MDPRGGERMCERCTLYKEILETSAELIQSRILSTMVDWRPTIMGISVVMNLHSIIQSNHYELAW